MARRPPKRQVKAKPSREQKNKKFMSILLAVLMVVSLAGIFFGQQSLSQNTSFSYGDYDFDLIQDPTTGQYFFVTEVANSEIPFYTLPEDALRIPVQGNLDAYIDSASVIIFSTDGNESYLPIFDEIRFGLDVYANKYTGSATLGPVEGSTLPVLSCVNATASQAVMEIMIGNRSEIVTTDYGCASVTLREIDVALFRDLLLYHALGIIEE